MPVTSEFSTGSIGPALPAVPRRRLLFGAEAAVAGLSGLRCGALCGVPGSRARRRGDQPRPPGRLLTPPSQT